MIRYWGVFVDETGCEFSAVIEAEDKGNAWEIAKEDYPESRCVQLESPEDTAEREARMEREVARELDGDYYEDCEDDDEEAFEEPELPVYVVSQQSDGKWLSQIAFPNGDTDDIGFYETEDEAKASAEQWLDEYNSLSYDEYE